MKDIKNNVCLRDFGYFIRSARKRKGLTQVEVAQMVGLHQTYYGKIERAHREVDLLTAMSICQALGLDLSDFIKQHM